MRKTKVKAKPKKQIIHLNDKAKELVKKLQGGFNGVYISARYEEPPTREEVVPSEMTNKGYDKYTRDLAYFIAEPDFSSLTFGRRDSAYVSEPEIDTYQFYEDLEEFIRKEVGPGVKINYKKGCGEFELIRNNK